MSNRDSVQLKNEAILDRVDALGGGSVWEPEIFAVTLYDVPISDADIAPLTGLRGVQQIALNAKNLSFSAVEAVACIPDLESLVLLQPSFSREQLSALRAIGPDIEVVTDDA